MQNPTSQVLLFLTGGRDGQAVAYEMWPSAARRTPKRVVKCGFCLSLGNSLRRSRVLDGQTCGVVKCESPLLPATASAEHVVECEFVLAQAIVQVGRSNMWQNAILVRPDAARSREMRGSTAKNWCKIVILKAHTSCASSLVAVAIFFPLLSCTVTALILIRGFFACSPDSSGLVAACCWVVCFLLLLALPSCTCSSSDLLVVGGLLTGVVEVPSLIVVWVVDVGSPPVFCFFVSSVLAFFACAGVVSSRCCVGLAAGTVVLSCDEAWPCWSAVSACCACSVLAYGVVVVVERLVGIQVVVKGSTVYLSLFLTFVYRTLLLPRVSSLYVLVVPLCLQHLRRTHLLMYTCLAKYLWRTLAPALVVVWM